MVRRHADALRVALNPGGGQFGAEMVRCHPDERVAPRLVAAV